MTTSGRKRSRPERAAKALAERKDKQRSAKRQETYEAQILQHREH